MDLHKSYQLTRFRLLIVIILLALMLGLFIRFSNTIQASIEEMSVEINMISMQQMVRDQNFMTKDTDKQCKFLDNPDMFFFANNSTGASGNPGSWEYDSKKHQLIYNVRSGDYFSSKFGQKIIIDLYCNKGIVILKKNPYMWCHNKKLWGCAGW